MFKEKKQNKVCDVGLWSSCRHPNYFFEWMVWNGLILAAIPSLLKVADHSNSKCPFACGKALVVTFALGLVYTSRMMYVFLLYQTGATPSEYYSVRKRPDYRKYQETTNQFWPSFLVGAKNVKVSKD